jgi:hypothetical protein
VLVRRARGLENITTTSEWKDRMESVRNATDDVLLQTEGVDWETIAANYVTTRSAADCRIQWTGNDDPHINKSMWTKGEDRSLLRLAEQHQGHAWVDIARALDVWHPLRHSCFVCDASHTELRVFLFVPLSLCIDRPIVRLWRASLGFSGLLIPI